MTLHWSFKMLAIVECGRVEEKWGKGVFGQGEGRLGGRSELGRVDIGWAVQAESVPIPGLIRLTWTTLICANKIVGADPRISIGLAYTLLRIGVEISTYLTLPCNWHPLYTGFFL